MSIVVKRICSLLAVAASMLGAASHAQTIAIGTNQPGTLFYSTGVAITEALASNDIGTRVQAYAGSGVLMALVDQGTLDFAVVNLFEMARAQEGMPPFKNKHENLRVAARLFDSQVGFLVGNDSDVQSLADIKGQRIASGYSAAPIIDLMRQAIVANAGYSEKDISKVSVPNTLRGGELLASSRLDVAFLSAGSGAVEELNASMGGVKFLSLNDDDESIKALQSVMPQGYPAPMDREVLPSGIDPDTKLLTYSVALVVNQNFDDQRLTEVLEALTSNTKILEGALANFRGIDRERMGSAINVDYHDAAAAYFAQTP